MPRGGLETGELDAAIVESCRSAGPDAGARLLPALVTSLYLAGMDAGDATEALFAGGCGSLSEIVRELVAQGGDEVLGAVVARATALGGGPAEMAVAAGQGLDRNLETMGGGALPPGQAIRYAMAYYPSEGGVRRVDASARAVDRLFQEPAPGYGVYTFVLVSRELDELPEVAVARYQELFRIIETYVGGPDATGGAVAGAHVFLIPVYPDLEAAPLIEQVAVDLATAMSQRLARVLAQRGQQAAVQRLEKGAGPFLLAAVEPDPLAPEPWAPWLFVDLSGLGPELMYQVVDAYDRSVPTGETGRAAALIAIRERLLDLGRSVADVAGSGLSKQGGATSDAWVMMLGPLDSNPSPGTGMVEAEPPPLAALRPGWRAAGVDPEIPSS